MNQRSMWAGVVSLPLGILLLGAGCDDGPHSGATLSADPTLGLESTTASDASLAVSDASSMATILNYLDQHYYATRDIQHSFLTKFNGWRSSPGVH